MEQADVEPRLELLGPLGPERVRSLDDARGEAAEARQRGVRPHALGIATDHGGARVDRGGQVRIGFLAGLAVGSPQLAEAQERPLAHGLRELPRHAGLGEPAAQVILVERRGAVVTHGAGQEQLAVGIERRLPEVRRAVNHGLGVDRDVASDGVAELVRQRSDQGAAHVGELADVAAVQVLAERHGAAEPRGERVVGRGGQIVVDLIVDQLALGHPPAHLRWRGRLGSPLEPLVVRVVGAEGVVHLDPGGGHEFGGHVAEDAADLGRVLGHVQHEEGIVPAAVRALVLGQRILEAERLVLPVGREVGQVIPVRRRAQQPELQAVGVVAALQVVAARVHVGDVGAQLEVVAQAVGSIESHRGSHIQVIGAGEDSPVAQVGT